MKKQILNLGKALDKAAQKSIHGGASSSLCHRYFLCADASDCVDDGDLCAWQPLGGSLVFGNVQNGSCCI